MNARHPFAVCTQCLFGQALEDTPAAAGAADSPLSHTAPGLFQRRDFFRKYDILEPVAKGGQGEIWKAWDFELRRAVAMKRLNSGALSSEPVVYRFLAEAQIASQLEHPGILPIFDVGLDPDGRPFYTTILLSGSTFEEIWRRVHSPGQQEWTIARALELLVRVCEIMAYAHGRGVIHRDLKPANILVGAFGDVRVVDWGSAHVMAPAQGDFAEPFVQLNRQVIETDRGEAMWALPDSPLATANAGQPVTLVFAPPEIVTGGGGPPDPRTDIYAVGVMLYALLANRLPYADRCSSILERAKLEQQLRSGALTPVRAVARGVSRDLAAVCEKAMAVSPEERYGCMEELAQDLRAVLQHRPVTARRSGLVSRAQKWVRRNPTHALSLGVVLVIFSGAFFIIQGIRAQRDVDHQVTALRNAELATRNGHWREALRYWDEAEAGGYKDRIYLALHRAEAWTILSEPARSGALLRNLAGRSDLGKQRGAVWLRLGEHELFDRDTAQAGVQHVRDALNAGLADADRAFAQGLLADSTPAALVSFRDALRFDPYHHGAHRHSLSLEFLLGDQLALSNHAAAFKILYPDDPSPRFLEVAELALHGRLNEAQGRLALLRPEVNSNAWNQFDVACRAFGQAAAQYNIQVFLTAPSEGSAPRQITVDWLGTGLSPLPGNARTPRLPCLKKGLIEAGDGLRSLLLPYLGNPSAAVDQIESGSHFHPEALIPVLAGLTLENKQPQTGPKSLPILRLQQRLYERGAEFSSVMPGISRLALYLAARTDFELADRQTNSAPERANCLAYVRRATALPELSPAECRAYLEFALGLQDLDLARQLLAQWDRRQPADPAARKSRIQVELAAGAFGTALKLIDQWLVDTPGDEWALAQRVAAVQGLSALLDSSRTSQNSKPSNP